MEGDTSILGYFESETSIDLGLFGNLPVGGTNGHMESLGIEDAFCLALACLIILMGSYTIFTCSLLWFDLVCALFRATKY